MYTEDCSSSMGRRVLATIWTLAAMAIIVFALRLYSQQRVLRKLGWSDMFILLSLVGRSTPSTSLTTVAIAHALGNHMACLTTPGKIDALQWEYAGILPGKLSAPLARIAFCLYMLPFGSLCKKWRICFWTLIVSQLLINIACMVGAAVICGLSLSQWDISHGSICWASRTMIKVSFAQGAFKAATNLLLTILPFLITRKPKIARSTKIVLSILLGMSIVTMAACIFRTVELYRLSDSKDLTFETAKFIIWLALERYIAVIAASIPTIRPLALSVLRNRLKWFRTPSNHRDQSYGDRTWISRNPTRFIFDTEFHDLNSRRSMNLPCPSSQMRDDELVRLATFLNTPLPIPSRGVSIRKIMTVTRSSVLREEGEDLYRAYIEVSGLNRSAVGEAGESLDGIWEQTVE